MLLKDHTMQITATYVDGVFRPDTLVALTEGQRVRLVIEPLLPETDHAEALKALEEIWRTSKICSTEPHLTRDQLHERR